MPLRAHYERFLSPLRLGRTLRGSRLVAFLVEVNQPLRIEIHPSRNLSPDPRNLGDSLTNSHARAYSDGRSH